MVASSMQSLDEARSNSRTTTVRVTPPRRGSYGIDAPFAPLLMAAFFVLELALAILGRNPWLLAPALFILTFLGTYLHATLRGKFIIWAELLNSLQLQGHEKILDMGCGRGAVLLMAAQHLNAEAGGRAVGIDLWHRVDQSGNSMEATKQNAIAEGVADRVDVRDGDMMAIPFPDNSFDVVLSSLAIHNIHGKARRAKAISEAVRVLRPNGRLLIADIRATRFYQSELVRLGMNHVSRRRLGWRFWWGGPWAATPVVSATK